MDMREESYIHLGYKPSANDLICLFRIEPAAGVSMQRAAANCALESSVGTWTKLTTEKEYMKKWAAKVFSIKGNMVKIAYPQELFERDNMPNIMSSIAGNIFGIKLAKNLRLEDVHFPNKLLKSFPGPRFGIHGVRKFMHVKNRPFIGTIVKPKLGLNPKDHSECAYEAWLGGCDFVKDDENLASQDFNKFEKRLTLTLAAADKAESITGEKKAYLCNVTSETETMLKRAQMIKDQGGKYMMIDILTEGFGGLQTLRQHGPKLAIHGHRAMHAAMTRNPKHGINFMTLADFSRMCGIDSLHIGTGIGKLEGNIDDIYHIEEEIEEQHVKPLKNRLEQNWGKMKPTLAVSSGGLQPGDIPFLVNHLGKNLSIQMGGGIHGHPNGTLAGARAARQALDATLKRIPLKEYAKTHSELRAAIEKWKSVTKV